MVFNTKIATYYQTHKRQNTTGCFIFNAIDTDFVETSGLEQQFEKSPTPLPNSFFTQNSMSENQIKAVYLLILGQGGDINDVFSIQKVSTLYLYGMKVYRHSIFEGVSVNISIRFGKHKTTPTGKVVIEIWLPIGFKIWVEKCKYFEGMKEIVQLSMKRQGGTF